AIPVLFSGPGSGGRSWRYMAGFTGSVTAWCMIWMSRLSRPPSWKRFIDITRFVNRKPVIFICKDEPGSLSTVAVLPVECSVTGEGRQSDVIDGKGLSFSQLLKLVVISRERS